jgi:hypothetical protein
MIRYTSANYHRLLMVVTVSNSLDGLIMKTQHKTQMMPKTPKILQLGLL